MLPKQGQSVVFRALNPRYFNRIVMNVNNIIIFNIIILQIVMSKAELSHNVTVNVLGGRLIGTVKREGSRGSYIAFKGIPYAKPPIGDLRFKDPVPAESWTGERRASSYGHVCVQKHIRFDIIGDEDCLYLNVFTKDIQPLKKRAVMVWIHGGGFFFGAGSFYGPDYIVLKEVVLVTLNYRLGVLGFLNLYDNVATGNQGLKDQVMALQWVRDNIAQFGGDPENVTIFGQDAGGVSVYLLAISPFAKGLFHKAISQSGVVLNHWSWTKRTRSTMNKGFQLAAKLGNETSDPKVAYEFLKTIKAEKLVKIQQKYFCKYSWKVDLPFTPSMDSESSNPFFPESIKNYIFSGVTVPFMLGFTNNEGMVFVDSIIAGHMNEKKLKKINADFQNLKTSTFLPEIAAFPLEIKKMRSLYFDDKPVSMETLYNFSDYYSDIAFIRGIIQVADLQAKILPVTHTYLYRFSYESEQPTIVRREMQYRMSGVGHTEDISFLFSYFSSKPTPGSNDYMMIRYMTDLWTNFAKTGNPTPAITTLTPVAWTPLRSGNVYSYLDINIDTQMKFFCKERERWDWEFRTNAPGDHTYISQPPLDGTKYRILFAKIVNELFD